MIDKNLKLLLLHTTYKTLGGEDIAYLNEANFLKKYFDVSEIKYSNNEQLTTSEKISFISNNNVTSNYRLEKKLMNLNQALYMFTTLGLNLHSECLI